MEKEKLCPFLKEQCIKNNCAIWMEDFKISPEVNGERFEISLGSMCSFTHSGIAAAMTAYKLRTVDLTGAVLKTIRDSHLR